jgi:hypothetical protein
LVTPIDKLQVLIVLTRFTHSIPKISSIFFHPLLSHSKYVVAMATKHLAKVSMESCGSRGCNPEMAYRCLSDADKYIKAAGSKLLRNSMTCG